MFKFAATAALLAVASANQVDNRKAIEEKFEAWRQEHGFEFEPEEYVKRMDIFEANEATIIEHNAKGLSYTLGHNAFSHLTWEEFQAARLNNPMPERTVFNYNHELSNSTSNPSSVDWTAAGAVTDVKDQGQCGSCWSFSTTGSVEGAYQIASGDLVSLSEQELVSCDGFSAGCNGGSMDLAFTWIKRNGGLCTEEDYPYTSGGGDSGTCDDSCTAQVTVGGHEDVPASDCGALETAVAGAPVSVAIEADQSAFQLYSSGVMTGSCGTNLDHGVLVTGYGSSSSDGDYWIVKNSWGASWGQDGYIWLGKGDDFGSDGQCGICMMASYPTGATSA